MENRTESDYASAVDEGADGSLLLHIKAVPGASETAFAGMLNGRLKIRVAAPPEKGKANTAIIRLLASQLGINRKNIKLISGSTAPLKTLSIDGIPAEELMKKLFR